MSSHEEYMLRAVQLAYRAFGRTRTNPMVGAVIVHDDRIIGEGFHTAYGEAHAEVEAIESVIKEYRNLISQSSLYVTLEPCAHYGKTPPCSLRIIEEKFERVYIGTQDPFQKVNGKGIQMLREAGIEVTTGLAEKVCKKLIHRFQTQVHKQRPYIHLKWAQSADGFLSRKGESTPISEAHTAFRTHKLRSQNDAILVGTNTLLTDNPSLDNRLYPGQSPIKIILDRKERIHNDGYRFFQSAGSTLGLLPENSEYIKLYDDHILLPNNLSNTEQLRFILKSCYAKNIGSVFVEGGRELLSRFINNQLWDQADIIRSGNTKLGEGIKAPVLTGQIVDRIRMGTDEYIRLYPATSNVKDYLKP